MAHDNSILTPPPTCLRKFRGLVLGCILEKNTLVLFSSIDLADEYRVEGTHCQVTHCPQERGGDAPCNPPDHKKSIQSLDEIAKPPSAIRLS